MDSVKCSHTDVIDLVCKNRVLCSHTEISDLVCKKRVSVDYWERIKGAFTHKRSALSRLSLLEKVT